MILCNHYKCEQISFYFVPSMSERNARYMTSSHSSRQRRRSKSPSDRPRRKSNENDDSYKSSSHRASRRDDKYYKRDRYKYDERRSNRSRSRDRSHERSRYRNDRSKYDDGMGQRTGTGSNQIAIGDKNDYPEEGKIIKPNFKQSGLLAKASNTLNGTAMKYFEPPDSHMPSPKRTIALYVFEGDKLVEKILLNKRSWYLFGRDVTVSHITLSDNSCSKQHAVIQFRCKRTKNEFGDVSEIIRPYIIDLESVNSTFLNNEEIPSSRYVELIPKDIIKFGDATKEYVVMVID